MWRLHKVTSVCLGRIFIEYRLTQHTGVVYSLLGGNYLDAYIEDSNKSLISRLFVDFAGEA